MEVIMSDPLKKKTVLQTFDDESPPLEFGVRRLYYQYSVTIPQIHLILISILQGTVITSFLARVIPNPHVFSFAFLLQIYFYLPYILTFMVILIAWMDFVYASGVLIWPPTAFQATLIFLLALAEIAMVNSIDTFYLWRIMLGLTTVIGGFMRLNNFRIFKGNDFADYHLGKRILSNELIYGLAYVILGLMGASIGLIYSSLLIWTNAHYPHIEGDRVLHWVFYSLILLEVSIVLIVDVIYRQWLLRRLTRDTDLEITPHGGIRHKSIAEQNSQKEQEDLQKALPLDIDSPDEWAEELLDKERLYSLAERWHWSALTIDFKQDRIDWHTKLTEKQREAICFIIAMFLDGEERVTTDLAPFLMCAPSPEYRHFLATQIADEARHHVFFDRFLQEVVSSGSDSAEVLRIMQSYLSPQYRSLFAELNRTTSQLRYRPHDTQLLTQAIVLYYLMAEGLAHTGQHFLRTFGEKTKLLPGFVRGINLIARDESRHIAFGLQWLRELVKADPQCKIRAIQTLNRVLLWSAGILFTPEFDISSLHSLGVSNRETCIFVLRSIEAHLKYAGIAPDETLPLLRLGASEPIEVQAERILVLMECGIFTSAGTLHITEEAIDILFHGICNTIARSQRKHKKLGITIQWVFDDDEAKPRYLIVNNKDGTRIEIGTVNNPHLLIRVTAQDWARITTGSVHPLQALLSRRLRVSGSRMHALRFLFLLLM
jgi:ribonucleoside-diphosphate reductase beta chain